MYCSKGNPGPPKRVPENFTEGVMNKFTEDYIKEIKDSYKFLVFQVREFNELREKIDHELYVLEQQIQHIAWDETGDEEVMEDMDHFLRMIEKIHENIQSDNIQMDTTIPQDVQEYVYELMMERRRYGIAGHRDPDRVREIQKEIETILSQYDR